MGSVYSLADDENSMKRNNYDGGDRVMRSRARMIE